MASPPADLASAFDPLTLANVLEVKATANAGGFQDAGPRSVVAVEETATLREALDELALSNIKSVPVRAKTTGEILGFFDAAIGVRVALEAAESGEGPEKERLALERRVNDVINPSLVSGARGDGGSVPFACADLPIRELISEHGYLLFEQHCDEPIGKGQSGSWWFNAEVHRLCVVDARAPADASPRKPSTPPDDAAKAEGRYDPSVSAPGASRRVPSQKPKWEEIIDVVSQMDVVRCLLYAADDPEDKSSFASLKRALGEPALKHASRPFCTFQDAPLGGVYREMLDKGYSAACVVRLSKWTLEHAGDPSAWRAVDTLSFSDFASESFSGDDAKAVAALREPKGDPLLGGVEDPSAELAGGHTVGTFLRQARRPHAGLTADAVDEAATVADAARLMTDKREHRAWILDANETPIGVLTCTDVLRCVATAVGRHAGEDRLRRAVREADARVDEGRGPIVEEAA
jgi:CBS domain-containing protein